MIQNQYKYAKEQFSKQAKLLFKPYKNKPKSKRDYLDEICDNFEEEFKHLRREEASILISACHARLREIWKNCGHEAVWDIIKDE